MQPKQPNADKKPHLPAPYQGTRLKKKKKNHRREMLKKILHSPFALSIVFFSSYLWPNYKVLLLEMNTRAEDWRPCFMAPAAAAAAAESQGHISPPYYQDDSCWPSCHRRVLDINKRLLRHPVINIRTVSLPNIICLGEHSFDQTKH